MLQDTEKIEHAALKAVFIDRCAFEKLNIDADYLFNKKHAKKIKFNLAGGLVTVMYSNSKVMLQAGIIKIKIGN